MRPTNDIVIMGGGVIGLAIAIDLKLRGAAVTVLSRDFQQAAVHAAAGMLAPRAEAIVASPMLDLCLESLALYPGWISKLEDLSATSTGYWSSGILAPLYAPLDRQNQECSGSPPDLCPNRVWLDRTAIHQAQPGLSRDVVGAWWYPEEGQVDNRALAQALRLTAEVLGIDIQAGVAVTGIQQHHGRVTGLSTTAAIALRSTIS
ncbi:MAG: FAD-dependent oxidoreductase [Leptolyngbyaceae cyanobacterium CRU_2_3]|nr:FAD-dependent oxidoreductase [Leptolyngbyaceae cyanobacterium CRU_2_3]